MSIAESIGGHRMQISFAYDDVGLAVNLPIWLGLIESGKKTADQIIAMVSSKATMTEEQIAMVTATVEPTTIDAE